VNARPAVAADSMKIGSDAGAWAPVRMANVARVNAAIAPTGLSLPVLLRKMDFIDHFSVARSRSIAATRSC